MQGNGIFEVTAALIIFRKLFSRFFNKVAISLSSKRLASCGLSLKAFVKFPSKVERIIQPAFHTCMTEGNGISIFNSVDAFASMLKPWA